MSEPGHPPLDASVYGELRRLAAHYMRQERPGHVLQPTALVNEAYLRLAQNDRMEWRDRSHFVAMAATHMRRILVDCARNRDRVKRGGGVHMTSIEGHDIAHAQPDVDIEALDEALTALAAFDETRARIVELRYFGGLTIDETAGALGISAATVSRDWIAARAWLRHYLENRS